MFSVKLIFGRIRLRSELIKQMFVLIIQITVLVGLNCCNNNKIQNFKFYSLGRNVNNDPIIEIDSFHCFNDSQFTARLTINPWCLNTSIPIQNKVVFICDFEKLEVLLNYRRRCFFIREINNKNNNEYVLFDFNSEIKCDKVKKTGYLNSILESKILFNGDTIFKFRVNGLPKNDNDVVFYVSEKDFITGMYISNRNYQFSYGAEGPIFERVGKVFYFDKDSIRNDSLISIYNKWDKL